MTQMVTSGSVGGPVRHEAAPEMGEGPPESSCRGRLQTTAGCVG
jgi:hypothetical protein